MAQQNFDGWFARWRNRMAPDSARDCPFATRRGEIEKYLPLELGKVEYGPEVRQALEDAGMNFGDLVIRHRNGDWGDVDPDAWAENDERLKEPRWYETAIVSTYRIPGSGKTVVFCTDCRWNATSIVLMNDY